MKSETTGISNLLSVGLLLSLMKPQKSQLSILIIGYITRVSPRISQMFVSCVVKLMGCEENAMAASVGWLVMMIPQQKCEGLYCIPIDPNRNAMLDLFLSISVF